RVAEYSQVNAAEIEPDRKNASGALSAAAKASKDAATGDLFGNNSGAKAPPAIRARATSDTEIKTPQALAAARLEAVRKLPVQPDKHEIVRSLDRLKSWIARIDNDGSFAVEALAPTIDPMQAELCGIALAVAPNDACYVPLGHRQSGDGAGLFAAGLAPDQIAASDALKLLKPVLESGGHLKVGFNVKFTAVLLARHGIVMQNNDDVELISYALDAGRGSHDLPSLAKRWLGHASLGYGELIGSGRNKLAYDQVPIDRATSYAAEYADLTLRLWQVLKPRLVAERMTTVYETLERPMIATLARMEQRGITIDRQVLSRLSSEFAQTAARLEAEIHELAGEPINVGSPKQIGDIMFGKMGLPGGSKTKTGAWSTSAQILDELAEQGHDFPRKILDWRQVSKLKSTYTDALPEHVDPQTRRVHTTYALAATTTGRLSSNEPNLQNIPVRNEEGRKIRRAFIATPGHKLVSADYSQIELRLLAEIADIPVLKQAFRDGLDIHAMTASEMFGVPVQGMPGEIRRRAKAINFGIIYGISAFGLANQLGIPREEAAAYIKKYFERFPGIRAYMDATRDFCREHGYVITLFGRKCHYPDIKSPNPSHRAFNERAAINARLQGTAADIIRRAMVRMDDALAGKKLSAKMLLQVHDELIFEVPDDEVAATLPVVQHVMQDAPFPAVLLSVPLRVDARAADNWDEAH
ncbi:MAG: DNA polymerase I, partial [Nitrobacter sp. 62-13]|uniref:DNA polymerase I n=1 Tax=Nitrobacter sp. 62-13 TaxID=1895797 RepID=UPI000969CE21